MSAAKHAAPWLALTIAAVGAYEGLRLKSYPDIGNIPTICYGETRGVKLGQTASKKQCDEQLSKRLMEFSEGVNSCVKVDLPDTRRSAFVSLSYNIGIVAFCHSTVVKRINAGDVVGACDAILAWNRVKGNPIDGLTRRRKGERALCLKGVV